MGRARIGPAHRAARLGAALVLLAGGPAAQEEARRPLATPVPADAVLVRVFDEEGRPLAGAEVAVRPEGGSGDLGPDLMTLRGWGWRRHGERTGEDGTALVGPLEAGRWHVAAGGPPERGYRVSEALELGSEVELVVARLPRERLLAGTVVGPTGEPVRGALVRWVWHDGRSTRTKTTHSETDGVFRLLADGPDRVGALHASVYRSKLRSAAIDPVSPGSADLVLRLGAPRFFTVEARNQRGEDVPFPRTTFYWQLAGGQVEDYPGWQEPGQPLRWELPTVPFYVALSASGHEPARVGPIDPTTVGGVLDVLLEAHPRVRGRVLHHDEPVEHAAVELSIEPAASRSPSVRWWRPSRWSRVAVTDADGRFDFALRAPGTRVVRAWSGTVGEGTIGPLELTGEDGQELPPIEITRAPGAIEGRVLLPPDRGPEEVWLTATRRGYLRLAEDGSFRMPAMEPGEVEVHVRRSFDVPGPRPVSTTVAQDGDSPWVHLSHGPTRAPDWLPVETVFRVLVEPGRTAALEIDLTELAPCRLEGRLLVDGAPLALEPREPDLFEADLPPTVALADAEGGPVSRTDLGADGRFTLATVEPGRYELWVGPPSAEAPWTIRAPVELVEGTLRWERDVATGSLRIQPRGGEWAVSIRGRGPDGSPIEVRRPSGVEPGEELLLPRVPAGTVEVELRDAGGATHLETVEITPGREALLHRR